MWVEQPNRHLARWERQVQSGEGLVARREAAVWKLRDRAWGESHDSEILGMERVRENVERREAEGGTVGVYV